MISAPLRPARISTAIAVLFALTATSAAARDDKSSNWIRVQQLPTGGSMAQPGPSTQAEYEGWIQIEGWDWEVEKVDKVDGFTVKQGVKPYEPKPKFVTFFDPTNPDASPDDNEKRIRSRDAQPTATPVGTSPSSGSRPSGFLDYDEGDTGTHQASARGADKFGRVRVKFAWAGCARKMRLPSIELRDPRALYRLEDVSVVGCAADGATFRYARRHVSTVSSLAAAPALPGTARHVPGGVGHIDDWAETAAKGAGKRTRGYLKPIGRSTQATGFDIVDMLTCLFCVVPTGRNDSNARVAGRPGGLTIRTTAVGRCVAGARYPSMQLRLDGKDYRLGGVTVASCTGGGRGGGSLPMEEISFNYDQMVTIYPPRR